MAHYFVTGGAGFIGSHLAELLILRHHEVTVLDDLSSGKMGNLARLDGNPRFTCVVGSTHDADLVERLVECCDGVFHLAARVGVATVVADPIGCMHDNVRGTEVVCEAAARAQVPLLLASSSEVYGRSPKLPFREDDTLCIGPTSVSRWSYACAKALDEFRVFATGRQSDTPVVIVRLFNTTGPRQSSAYGMVLPRFVHQALAEEPLTVFGDGTQTRCFAYVTDVARTLLELLENSAAWGQVFNVGTDEEVSVLDLARMVIAEVNPALRIRFVPLDEVFSGAFQDVPRRVPDLARLRSLLGGAPSVSLREIVARTVAFNARSSHDAQLDARPMARPAALHR